MPYCIEVTFPMNNEFVLVGDIVENALGQCDGAGSDFVTRDMTWTAETEDEAKAMVAKALALDIEGIEATYYPML